jgi:hypothetical protein
MSSSSAARQGDGKWHGKWETGAGRAAEETYRRRITSLFPMRRESIEEGGKGKEHPPTTARSLLKIRSNDIHAYYI